jgi:hypothetical protein
MKVQKYLEYLILEGDSPEEYMDQVLTGIKKRLDPVFDEEKVKKMKDFKNANLRLLNVPTNDDWAATSSSLKYKFTDDDIHVYMLNIKVDLKDAINPNPDQDYNTSDIKRVIVTFDKYSNKDGGLEIVDKLMSRSVEPEKIDPDYLIKLKVDLDEGKTEPEKEEEFKIETGESQTQQPAQGASAQMPAEESPEQTETPAA